jgi:uncharacterized protein (TIGR02145 family)
VFFLSCFLSAQTTFNLSFTGRDSATWVQLDSIRVTNLSQGGDTLLHWPDTVLSFLYVDVGSVPSEGAPFGITQYYPNPSDGVTSLFLYVTDKDRVRVSVCDVFGRVVLDNDWILEQGHHNFQVQLPEDGLYLLTACWRGQSSTIKLLQQGTISHHSKLEKIGFSASGGSPKKKAGIAGFTIVPGDTLLICGYAGGMDKYIQDAPTASKNYTLQFGYNVPCESVPSFNYGGQTYTTVQISTQCWMAQNLNIGTMVNSVHTANYHSDVSNNGVIEKYCYLNDSCNCAEYGGLYDWKEAMDYTVILGTQGICPSGWHIPTDAEWCMLTTYLDATVNCNVMGLTGTDIGGKLKEVGFNHWSSPNSGATNSSGFTALGADYRFPTGTFDILTRHTTFWTSTNLASTSGIAWALFYSKTILRRDFYYKTYGLSVRCVRD